MGHFSWHPILLETVTIRLVGQIVHRSFTSIARYRSLPPGYPRAERTHRYPASFPRRTSSSSAAPPSLRALGSTLITSAGLCSVGIALVLLDQTNGPRFDIIQIGALLDVGIRRGGIATVQS